MVHACYLETLHKVFFRYSTISIKVINSLENENKITWRITVLPKHCLNRMSKLIRRQHRTERSSCITVYISITFTLPVDPHWGEHSQGIFLCPIQKGLQHRSHQPFCTKKRTSSLPGSQTDSVISQNISFSLLRKMDQKVLHVGQYVFTISKVFKL